MTVSSIRFKNLTFSSFGEKTRFVDQTLSILNIYNSKYNSGCPQNVSVKFEPKIPNISFIITAGKCNFWGVSKKELI